MLVFNVFYSRLCLPSPRLPGPPGGGAPAVPAGRLLEPVRDGGGGGVRASQRRPPDHRELQLLRHPREKCDLAAPFAHGFTCHRSLPDSPLCRFSEHAGTPDHPGAPVQQDPVLQLSVSSHEVQPDAQVTQQNPLGPSGRDLRPSG